MKLPNIPDEVWGARPLLKEVRAEAHRRTAGADAVLWSLLTLVAAHIPARVAIDTGIGVPVRPTLFAVLAGASGTGKSMAFGVARALLPSLPEPLPLSTGEGLIESFFGKVLSEQTQGPGKPPKLAWVRKRVRSNAAFWLDEGESLFRQMERPGNVLGPVLRSFWSGGTVGQANATEDLRRGLEAGSYTGGLVVGLQPDLSGQLLADTATGTAQRFVWTASTDAHLVDVAELGFRPPMVLQWSPPLLPGAYVMAQAAPTAEQFMEQSEEGKAWVPPVELPPVLMPLDPTVARGIRARQVALRRGDVEPDEQDTQRSTMQTKVAAVLAWTDGRLPVTGDDWELAADLLAASDRVREALLEHAERVVLRQREERGLERAQVARAESAAEVARHRCRTRIVDVLIASDAGSVSGSELRRAVTVGQRPFVAEVLAGLVEAGGVTAESAPGGGSRYTLCDRAADVGSDDNR